MGNPSFSQLFSVATIVGGVACLATVAVIQADAFPTFADPGPRLEEAAADLAIAPAEAATADKRVVVVEADSLVVELPPRRRGPEAQTVEDEASESGREVELRERRSAQPTLKLVNTGKEW